MPMTVNSLMRGEGADVFYDPGFRRMIESHMVYLRNLPDNRIITIDPHDTWKYEADMTGLFRKYKIPDEHHFIVMRMNDMVSPADINENVVELIVPDNRTIDRLRSVYQTINRKIT